MINRTKPFKNNMISNPKIIKYAIEKNKKIKDTLNDLFKSIYICTFLILQYHGTLLIIYRYYNHYTDG